MYLDEKIGVAVITYDRKDNFIKLLTQLKSIDYIDQLVVVKNQNIDYGDIDYSDIIFIHEPNDVGVGKCKNLALTSLTNSKVDHLFLIEDDMVIKNPDVFKIYIDTAKCFNLGHLNFGSAWDPKMKQYYSVSYIFQANNLKLSIYRRLCGSFSYFSKEVIDKIGLFDDRYINALEHVDHTYRISLAGYYTPFHFFADIYKSYDYLGYSDCGKTSTINLKEDYQARLIRASEIWLNKYKAPVSQILHANYQQLVDFLKKKLN